MNTTAVDRPTLQFLSMMEEDGPIKKFQIIKFYGDELRKATKIDLSKLGCRTLLSLLGVA